MIAITAARCPDLKDTVHEGQHAGTALSPSNTKVPLAVSSCSNHVRHPRHAPLGNISLAQRFPLSNTKVPLAVSPCSNHVHHLRHAPLRNTSLAAGERMAMARREIHRQCCCTGELVRLVCVGRTGKENWDAAMKEQ